MAVYKLTDKPRTRPWCADYYCGKQRTKSYFRTKDEAIHCERSELASIAATGLPLRVKDREKHTVKDIIEYYRDNKAPQNEGSRDDLIRLTGFLKYDICRKGLPYVTRQDATRWMKQRRSETYTVWNAPNSEPKQITPRTVRREMNLWVQIFQTAIDEFPGCETMPNIFAGLKVRGSKFRRKRRLVGDELERLDAACDACKGLNTFYVRSAIYLFIETGMRLQEMFNLKWEDVDFNKRRIEIRKSKTDYQKELKGRTIVLTVGAMTYLLPLMVTLKAEDAYKDTNRIFPMSKGAFQQAFSLVRERANINPNGEEHKRLTPHNLRNEAASRMDEAGLTLSELKLMLGQASNDVTLGYVNSALQSIQDKLDRYADKQDRYAFGFTFTKAKYGIKVERPTTITRKAYERKLEELTAGQQETSLWQWEDGKDTKRA